MKTDTFCFSGGGGDSHAFSHLLRLLRLLLLLFAVVVRRLVKADVI